MKIQLINHLINRLLTSGKPSKNLARGTRLISKWKYRTALLGRREILKGFALLPVMGSILPSVFASKKWVSFEEKNLIDKLKGIRASGQEEETHTDIRVPQAKIGDVKISRMILGGNVIGGWAHARDLLYVSDLVKKYFTDEKIFETFTLAEKYGINAFLTNPVLCRVINEYWKQDLGKIKFISDGGFNPFEGVPLSVENGASACYVHGGAADAYVENGKVEEIGRALELIRSYRIPAGIGAHKLETVKACVEQGIIPDFWMKTIHRTNYWSANKINQNDNIWCTDPEDVTAFMKNMKQPWIGYKILAAGAIDPKEGMRYAFESGADFICVGMFDFQITKDVKTVVDILNSDLKRARPWMA